MSLRYIRKRRSRNIPESSVEFNLKSTPSCQTLSKAFGMSKKYDLISNDGVASKDWEISCAIESNWFMHESDGRKLDSFRFKGFSF